MSFNKTVHGLKRGIPVGDRRQFPCHIEPSYYECAGLLDTVVQCKENNTGGDSEIYETAAMAAAIDPTADFYTVALYLDGPVAAAGTFTCKLPGTFSLYESPCDGIDNAQVNRSVTVTPFSFIDEIGDALPSPDATAVGAPAALGHWPDTTTFAYMVNPSPTWPTPDFTGNTYGQVLFAPEDLPSDILVDFSVVGSQTGAAGICAVTITPYVITELPPRDAPFMCVL